MTTSSPQNVMDLEDAFVKVWFQEEKGATLENGSDNFPKEWLDNASAKHSTPELFGADILRKIYPKHSLVMTQDRSLDLLGFPGVYVVPLKESSVTTNIMFIPLARSIGTTPGVLVDSIEFGSFQLAWDKYEFIVYIAKWSEGFNIKTQTFILYEGSEEAARNLLLSAGIWKNQLHDEIWVFNQGNWTKDHSLWMEIQKADWKDVILKEDFKKALQSDVYGFFDSEAIYKDLAIPWKRGLIMHGPPGNGKTISLKAIMKSCAAKGFAPLYVKSFQFFAGEEAAMANVFRHARQWSPCVIILEDLDSLINDKNRSFFLNQLDGLESNNGLLIVGTTNHFDRLDPGLSTRPSRFDRKYLFDDPDRDERALYAKYWQDKLKGNKTVAYPDSLVDIVADATDGFSFAYLKEAFVSSLVLLASYEGTDKPDFASLLMKTIKTLREQLSKDPKDNVTGKFYSATPAHSTPFVASSNKLSSLLSDSKGDSCYLPGRTINDTHGNRIYASQKATDATFDSGNFRSLFDSLSADHTRGVSDRLYTTHGRSSHMNMPGGIPSSNEPQTDL